MLQYYLSSRLARLIAWSFIALLIYLSLVPQELEIRTGAPGDLEHVFAYTCTAGAFALAYPRRNMWTITLWLAIFSCALEFLQEYVPGRTALLTGALSSGAGAALGALIATKLITYEAMWAKTGYRMRRQSVVDSGDGRK